MGDPLPALVGASVSLLHTAPRRPLLRSGLPALGFAVLVATGHPLWASDNAGASLTAPSWKVPAAELGAARRIIDVARADGTDGPVLAPTTTSYAVSLVSARVHPAVSRANYMAQLAVVPGGHLDERLLLESFADGRVGEQDSPQVLSALSRLGVQVACVAGDGRAEAVLAQAGWVPVGPTPTCVLFVSPTVRPPGG